MKFRVALLSLITLLSMSVTSIRSARAACTESSGAVEDRTYRSRILGATMGYTAYLPPCYGASENAFRNYPIVYLMHGSDAVDTKYWIRLGLIEALDKGIADGSLPPMIAILPFGGDIANLNQFGTVSWSNIFLTELMPDAESAFRAQMTRDGRAIGGISRGGFWAFVIAFRRPDLFGALGGHSPFFWEGHQRSANPLFTVETAPGIETLRIWMDRGKNDYAAPGIEQMKRGLDKRGLIHVYIVFPQGEHNGAYWSAHIGDYLKFYAAGWPKESVGN